METKEMTMEELVAFVNSLDKDKEVIIHVMLGREEMDESEESL